MKLIIILLIGLVMYTTPITSSTSANLERYPTNTEVEELRRKFRRQIHELEKDKQRVHIIQDSRTSSEKIKRQALVKACLNRDKSIAKFLGSWSEYETLMHVYPSKKKEHICLVFTGYGQGSFEIGRVIDGKLRNSRGGLLFLEGNYLGFGYLSLKYIDGVLPSIGEFPFHSPKALKNINELVSGMSEVNETEKSLIIRDFQKYECLNS